jgi:hypothetical protein
MCVDAVVAPEGSSTPGIAVLAVGLAITAGIAEIGGVDVVSGAAGGTY